MSNKRLYRMYFRVVEKDFNPERRYVKKIVKTGTDLKIYLAIDGSYTVLEEDLKKYWDFGGGIDKIEFAGELDEEYFKPSLSEPDFIDNQIKSKKSGEVIGFQG